MVNNYIKAKFSNVGRYTGKNIQIKAVFIGVSFEAKKVLVNRAPHFKFSPIVNNQYFHLELPIIYIKRDK